MAKIENRSVGLYDKSRQVDLIAESMIGAVNLYPHEIVSLFPILDNLLRLVQEPRGISFLRKSGKAFEPVFTSLEDPDLRPALLNHLAEQATGSQLKNLASRIPDSDFFICAHKISLPNGIKNPSFTLAPGRDFERLFTRLDGDQTGLGRNVLDCLRGTLPNMHLETPSSHNIDWRTEAKKRANVLRHFDNYQDKLRKEINSAFESVSHSYLLRHCSGFHNLFCVVRTATNTQVRQGFRGTFDYTAQVVLTSEQWKKVEKFADPRLLEKPLGSQSRSIADSVFHSGLIDFSDEATGQGRDISSPDHKYSDYLRHEVENLIYPKIANPPHTFYVPIHVSGVPSLALFTISEKPKDPTDPDWWAHNHEIYSTLIPPVADKLRVGMKRLYLESVSEIFSTHVTIPDVKLFVAKVNEACEILSYLMPFSAIQLFPNEVIGADVVQLPHGRRVWLKLQGANPHFLPRQLDFELLTQEEVKAVCVQAAQLAQLEWQETINETQQMMSYTVAHDTRTTLNNGVIRPLEDCLKTSTDLNLFKSAVHRAIARVETYRNDLSFWLDGIADLYAPGAISLHQSLDAKNMPKVLSASSLALNGIGELPTIQTTMAGAARVDLHVSERSFKALFHLLMKNSVEAILEKNGSVSGEIISVSAEIQEVGQPYCNFQFWNSSTKFNEPVLKAAGHRPYTTAPRQFHSGLGFFIIEQLLKLCHAKVQPDGRHFVLANTHNPEGVEISFALPLTNKE